MSVRREQVDPLFTVFVLTKKNLELTVLDPDTNMAKDLVDANVYATGIAKIYKPDLTQVGADMPVTFENRASGIVSFIVLDDDHTLAVNAGNWYGEIEFVNTSSEIVDQQQFSIDIKVSP